MVVPKEPHEHPHFKGEDAWVVSGPSAPNFKEIKVSKRKVSIPYQIVKFFREEPDDLVVKEVFGIVKGIIADRYPNVKVKAVKRGPMRTRKTNAVDTAPQPVQEA